jgi:micrococcal nuclease
LPCQRRPVHDGDSQISDADCLIRLDNFRPISWLFSLLVVAVQLATPGDAQSRTLIGQVIRVVDGDTIHVRLGDHIEKVRYIGMNAPELHHPTKGVEPLAREAMEANRKLVQGQTVRLELDVQERDRYGRLLAYVYVGDTMINAELVAQGYAQVMTIPPNVKHQDEFLKLQREARALQLGLWKGAGPAPPGSAPSPTAPPTTQQDSPKQGEHPAQGRPGVPPQDARTCPATHPIKGNFTTYSGERCIYHVPGGAFYGKTKPERCYASDEEARQDGCRPSRR